MTEGPADRRIPVLDWIAGDRLGLEFPAHAAALRAGGEAFLTTAFRASGTLAADNEVSRIVRCEDFSGGGTGRKLVLSVTYKVPQPHLPTELFVKFSRDFDDEIRDRSRHMLEAEVRLAALSRHAEFPIAVPRCVFADFHGVSGTGILITERIGFGQGGVERHYQKCRDYEMPDPPAHYAALVKALAKLAGTHKAGRLPGNADAEFPFDREIAIASDPIPYDARRLQNRVARYVAFAADFPQLLPANITSSGFTSGLMKDVARFAEHERAVKEYLYGNEDFIALCHWNANVDNAWFWRNAGGEYECGLLDWGRVGQMNVALALYGALSGAETELWDNDLDALLALFVSEYRSAGGPAVDVGELKLHLQLSTATMGLAYLMDAPPIIKSQMPRLADIEDRFDPRFNANEDARVQLHMMTMFLHQWQMQDFGAVLDGFFRRL